MGRWLSVDPYRQFYSPYVGMGNSPIIGIDPTGGICPTCPDGADYDQYRNSEYLFAYEDGVGAYSDFSGLSDQFASRPLGLDPSTLNKNIGGMHYPGGNNPQTFPDASGERQPDYSVTPTNLAEYPAIGHDRRYDNLGIAGASGLFTDPRAIGADWQFVKEELQIAYWAYRMGDYKTSVTAAGLGLGLGVAATPKTIIHMANPHTGYPYIKTWHRVSNIGVSNAPSR